MSYKVRLATEKDCDSLSKLKQLVWTETYRGIYDDSKIDNYDFEKNSTKFLNTINNPDIDLYVVEDNDKLVGYMSCGTPNWPYKDYKQEIGLLYLTKEYQRKVIGKELFNIGLNRIKEKGFDKFLVYCNKYNTNAQEFYKKMGGIVDNIDEDNDDKSIPQVTFLYKIK